MRLLNYYPDNSQTPRLALDINDTVHDVRQAAISAGLEGVPENMDALLHSGETGLGVLKKLAAAVADNATGSDVSGPDMPGDGFQIRPQRITGLHASRLDRDTLQFAHCLGVPEKIICIGLNYKRHAEESGMAVPDEPVLFSKFNNALHAHNADLPLCVLSMKNDYEVELGVVMGRVASNVSVDDALDHVFGYCTVNDMSCRDLQFRTGQWLLGKTADAYLPIGPCLVTADEVGDPQDLFLKTWVNGEIRQDSSTSDMIFTVAEIISYVSRYMTLKPGDLISTGTPEGVIFGMENPVWLRAGDEITVEVEKLGKLRNWTCY